ncbi:MAG: glutamate--cysteine ligase, partial [Casimicrobiaceae bacterium]
ARVGLADPAATPSARVLRDIEGQHGNSYFDFALARSAQTRSELLALPYPPEVESRFRDMADQSLAEQRDIEASDSLPFETYRLQYLGQDLLAGRA